MDGCVQGGCGMMCFYSKQRWVQVLSQEEQDVLHAAATKAASDFMAARMQRSKRCNSMLKQPGQIQAARRVGKPY